MTRSLLAGLIFVAMVRVATADTFTGYLSNAQSSPSDFLGDIELSDAAGESACAAVRNIPFPVTLLLDFQACDSDAEPTGELFFLSVVALPKPPDDELVMASPAAATAPPQERSGTWLLISVSTAIVLIGGNRALRFWRSSEYRA